MRLLITTDTVGGVWSFTRELTEELLRRGHAVALVSFGKRPSPDQTGWTLRQSQAHGDRFHFTSSDVPLEWMQDNGSSLHAGEPVLAAVAQQFRPDVLLSNQFCFGATGLKLPRVVVAHSDVLSWARACNPGALEPTPWLNQYTSLVQRGLLQAQALVAPTRWMLSALQPHFLLPPATAVIPNGLCIRQEGPAVSRQMQAISAGRLWDDAKGLDIFSDVQLPCPVLIAGDLHLDGEAASRTAPAGITALGSLSHPNLLQHFRQSAMYLCTSRYEPFGLAPLEAALCGCAVIARDLPSLREVWEDSALYFTDASGLQAQLQRLSAQPNALAEAQSRALARAQQFTVERMTDGYLAVFEHVLRQPGTAPYAA
jgi:glycogen(starch) synthase